MRVRINNSGIHQVTRSSAGPVFREIASYTRRVENRAKQKVGVDTGRMRSSISQTVRVDGRRVVGRVGSLVDYALYHHEGTGIYGPSGRPIRPVSSPFLVFTPRGSGRPVFAREVRGSKPNPFLMEALREVVPWPLRTPK